MQEIHTNILQQTCVSDAKTFIKEYDTILTEHNKHHGFYQNKDAQTALVNLFTVDKIVFLQQYKLQLIQFLNKYSSIWGHFQISPALLSEFKQIPQLYFPQNS